MPCFRRRTAIPQRSRGDTRHSQEAEGPRFRRQGRRLPPPASTRCETHPCSWQGCHPCYPRPPLSARIPGMPPFHPTFSCARVSFFWTLLAIFPAVTPLLPSSAILPPLFNGLRATDRQEGGENPAGRRWPRPSPPPAARPPPFKGIALPYRDKDGGRFWTDFPHPACSMSPPLPVPEEGSRVGKSGKHRKGFILGGGMSLLPSLIPQQNGTLVFRDPCH